MPESDWISALQRLTSGRSVPETQIGPETTLQPWQWDKMTGRGARSGEAEAVPLGEDPISIIASILAPILRSQRFMQAGRALAPAPTALFPHAPPGHSLLPRPSIAIDPTNTGTMPIWPPDPSSRELMKVLTQHLPQARTDAAELTAGSAEQIEAWKQLIDQVMRGFYRQ